MPPALFQAFQLAFFTMLPSILLSGFMFPIAGMPTLVQWLAHVIPLTYYLEILRGVILKGVGIGMLWRRILPLAFLMCAILTVAVKRFHKRLD